MRQLLSIQTLTKSVKNTSRYWLGLSVELGNLVAENHGLDIDKESYLILLTLIDGLWYIAESCWPVTHRIPPNNHPTLTSQDQKIPSIQHVEGVDDVEPSVWALMTHNPVFPGLITPTLQTPIKA
jgi:hypothetical protein